jgi:hypothetical protein
MKTIVACGVATYMLAATSWAADMPTFGPGEINMDYRDNMTAADQKYNKWFLLSGVVQAHRIDSWKKTWLESQSLSVILCVRHNQRQGAYYAEQSEESRS